MREKHQRARMRCAGTLLLCAGSATRAYNHTPQADWTSKRRLLSEAQFFQRRTFHQSTRYAEAFRWLPICERLGMKHPKPSQAAEAQRLLSTLKLDSSSRGHLATVLRYTVLGVWIVIGEKLMRCNTPINSCTKSNHLAKGDTSSDPVAKPLRRYPHSLCNQNQTNFIDDVRNHRTHHKHSVYVMSNALLNIFINTTFNIS